MSWEPGRVSSTLPCAPCPPVPLSPGAWGQGSLAKNKMCRWVQQGRGCFLELGHEARPGWLWPQVQRAGGGGEVWGLPPSPGRAGAEDGPCTGAKQLGCVCRGEPAEAILSALMSLAVPYSMILKPRGQ